MSEAVTVQPALSRSLWYHQTIESRCLAAMIAFITLAGCATYDAGQHTAPRQQVDGPPDTPLDPAQIQDAVPQPEPISKYGNPLFYDVFGTRYFTEQQRFPYRAQGVASWYGKKFHGLRTSSGESYNMFAMTAAHRSLPLPTYARVTNLDNRKSAIVKINDRGPFHSERLIDLSYAAAVKLGIADRGTGRVEIETIDPGSPSTSANATQPPPAARPPTITASPRGRQVFVQCGAFSDKRNAENLEQQIRQMHEKAHIADTTSPQGDVLYRVRIGPLADAREVAQLHGRLSQLGLRPYVVYEAEM